MDCIATHSELDCVSGVCGLEDDGLELDLSDCGWSGGSHAGPPAPRTPGSVDSGLWTPGSDLASPWTDDRGPRGGGPSQAAAHDPAQGCNQDTPRLRGRLTTLRIAAATPPAPLAPIQEDALCKRAPPSPPKRAKPERWNKENSPMKPTARFRVGERRKERLASLIEVASRPLLTEQFAHVDRVDWLRRLDTCPHVAGTILACLGPADLQSVAGVSRAWQAAVRSDPAAWRRLRVYRARPRHRLDKENGAALKEEAAAAVSRQSSNESTPKKARLALGSSNVMRLRQWGQARSPQLSPRSHRFRLYTTEAGKLGRNGQLTPCPQCSYPSRVDTAAKTAVCVNSSCGFEFCLRCKCREHRDASCRYMVHTSPSSPSTSSTATSRHTICSRMSKKALRRL